MNKMFTAVAISQLAERGKLSFDDPVSKYLSTDWLPREVGDKVKIEHLLTHTSGLGSHFTDELMNASRELYRDVDDYKPIVARQTPSFEAGTDWGYSNAGFLLLGAIVESVSGQTYFEYVRENVAKPAGMINTDCYDMDRPIENLALGYIKEPATDDQPEWRSNIFMHVAKGGPAGGGYSTVEDLLRSPRRCAAASWSAPKRANACGRQSRVHRLTATGFTSKVSRATASSDIAEVSQASAPI